ncbi:CBS domain-containing protein [Alkalicoccobacillus murimartini]|uniref:tRNA nucleotidyltransferase (CCA-adding enzyme) n=1 Tax=Alkalicoccobacillus murimartini TaxID=171685 RepID=A0ABT9YJX7_9BACI|nr:CBS domain-containing protein [Alkalicoccobacillus murimartini]MDQ0207913.1 tRNA nucleotidyltransferase (CCA-adding enzyme) [Alkalicoccobacillus murimartini]
MKILASHTQIDFDGLASLIGAKLIHTDAIIVLPSQQQQGVKQILSLYRDFIHVHSIDQIEWKSVSDIILVDASTLERCGIPKDHLSPDLSITVYDHHRHKPDPLATTVFQEDVGACVTLMIEQLEQNNISFSAPEATLMALGLYSDTGSFQHNQTTERDILAAAFLHKNGMELEIIKPFLEEHLTNEQQNLSRQLSETYDEYVLEGIKIAVCHSTCEFFVNGLATITEKLISTLDFDAVIAVVQMGANTYVTGRSQSNRLDLQALTSQFGGGGHKQAAAATIKNNTTEKVLEIIKASLPTFIQPAVTAGLMMSSPVHTINEEATIDEAAEALIRYGHTGMPIIDDAGTVTGMLSRRDLDKAQRHGLGHSPVHAYMSKELLYLDQEATLRDIQETMMTYNIGRIPILDQENLVGIVSRSDILSIMHNEEKRKQLETDAERFANQSLAGELPQHYTKTIYELLVLIGERACKLGMNSFLVGGGVRDLLLKRSNEDLDIVVEGDAIQFAEELVEAFGGTVKAHQTFGTAIWTTTTAIKVDLATARSEHYEQPALLPEVSPSSIREDLSRRDFTINAMAISLHPETFGELLDHFHGQRDLKNGQIRILHPLSFIEDPTRIFRAVRFAQRFSYQIHPDTKALAQNAGASLRGLSSTRVMHELDLMQLEGQLEDSLKSLNQLHVWSSLLGEDPSEKQWQHVDQLVQKQVDEPFILLAALSYQDRGVFLEPLKKYAESSKDRAFLQTISETDIFEEPQDLSLGEWHTKLHYMPSRSILFIGLTPELPFGPSIIEYVKHRDAMQPLLSGRDLLNELQIEPGPIYTTLLTTACSLQLDGKLQTKKDALSWAKSYHEES